MTLSFYEGYSEDLTHEAPPGWSLDPYDDFVFHLEGAACGAMLNNEVDDVRVELPCDQRIPPVFWRRLRPEPPV